jgi:hypothetical protein
MRRQSQDMSQITLPMLDFFEFTFIPAQNDSPNFLVNPGLLAFSIYTSRRESAMRIYKQINTILKKNYEEANVISEGQAACPVHGVYCYRIRYKLLVCS